MRAGRRWRVALALLGAAQVVLGLPAGTSATAGIDRGEAGGEAYALLARGVGGTLTPAGPGVVGPMAPAEASVPPTATVTRRTQTGGCDRTGTAACPAPELRSLRVADDAVIATLESGRHACPAQSGGAAGAIDRVFCHQVTRGLIGKLPRSSRRCSVTAKTFHTRLRTRFSKSTNAVVRMFIHYK